MSNRPQIKNHLRLEPLQEKGVFFLAEDKSYFVEGDKFSAVAPLINGENTIADITRLLQDKMSFFDVLATFSALKKRGYVVDGGSALPADLETYCHVHNIDTAVAYERLQAASIFIYALDRNLENQVRESVEKTGITLAPSQEEATATIVLTDDYLHPELERINQIALDNGRPWLLVKPTGLSSWIGPFFEPGETGCWCCLRQRLLLHREVNRFVALQKNIALPQLPSNNLSVMSDAPLSMAVGEVVKWVLSGERQISFGNVIAMNTQHMKMSHHPLTKRPQCSACGDATIVAKRTQEPLELQSQPKMFTRDGGHRSVRPEVTVARLEKHVSPITGLLKFLERREGSTELIHVYHVDGGAQFPLDSLSSLEMKLKMIDGGKGSTDIQSKASALCEAIERYSGSLHGDEVRIHASYRELGDAAIHPNDCMLYSEQQYSQKGIIKTRSHHTALVQRFDEERKLDWTPVWSLTEQQHKYLPTSYCFHGSRDVSLISCSNGNAAGNSLEEAALQGLLELIERDSVALWWYNRVRRQAVDLSTFDGSYVMELQALYDKHNRDLWVLDITSDLGVPTFVAVSMLRSGEKRNIIYGFGCHLDPRIGTLRALTELNQSLEPFLSGGEGTLPRYSEEATYWWETATIETQPYLLPDESKPALSLVDDYPQQWGDDIKEDVLFLVERLKENDVETLILDQSQPDIDLKVVKMFAPGLRHFWRRLGTGRLYDVPVKMGWQAEPSKEDELNQYTIIF